MKAFILLLKILAWSLLTVALAVTSQTGVLALPLYFGAAWMLRKIANPFSRFAARLAAFLVAYFFISFAITPMIARQQGRVRLPLRATEEAPLGPRNWIFVALNRNYCQPVLRDGLVLAAQRLRSIHPEAEIAYMDVGWPIGEGINFFPHISHGDGHKADIAFLYEDAQGNKAPGRSPTPFGYGSFDLPLEDEKDMSKTCLPENPYYSFCKIWRWRVDRSLHTDVELTRQLILTLAKDPRVVRMCIEPHLKQRWRLEDVSKIRFAGCRATRHDDHIHVEIR